MRRLLFMGAAGSLLAVMTIGDAGRVAASGESAAPAPNPGSPQFYNTRVMGILEDNCLACHDETAKGGLRLDSYAWIRKGGKDGPVIVSGDPDASMLIQAIRRT